MTAAYRDWFISRLSLHDQVVERRRRARQRALQRLAYGRPVEFETLLREELQRSGSDG